MHGDPDPAGLRQEDATRLDLDLLGIGIAEALLATALVESGPLREVLRARLDAAHRQLPPPLQPREVVVEGGVEIVDRLLQRVMGHLVQEVELLLERGQLLDLVKFGQALASAQILVLLLQAEIVDQPTAADRPPEELFLGDVGIDPVAIGLAQQHEKSLRRVGRQKRVESANLLAGNVENPKVGS